MNAQLKAELANARQCLLETFQLALTYGAEETQDPEMYLELAEKLCHIHDLSKQEEESLETAKQSRTAAEFEEIYNATLNNLKQNKKDAKKSSEFKEFKKELLLIKQTACEAESTTSSGGGNRVEDNDFVMESEINVFDPLTKKKMTIPVRNTVCGHHYEKASILEAIQINKRLRCPVAGCGNKQIVTKQNLQDDNVFKARLQKIAEQGEEDE